MCIMCILAYILYGGVYVRQSKVQGRLIAGFNGERDRESEGGRRQRFEGVNCNMYKALAAGNTNHPSLGQTEYCLHG